MVETGFPTSLADLFVKNRDRFLKRRRSSTQTKSSPPQPQPQSFPSPSSDEHVSSSAEQFDNEIQIESKSPSIAGVGNGCQSLETTGEISICKSDPSPSTRIKRNFIRKLVPKKLRRGKKLKKSKNKDQSGVEDVHKLDEIEEENQGPDDDDDDDDDESQTEEGSCKEDVGDKISTFVQLLRVESVKDELENVRKGKSLSGYLILILFVIVLAGLVGGKGVALLLTLVWCLILRFIGRQWRC